MAPTPTCLAPQVLSDLMDGRLVEPELSQHAAHLEECQHCQSRVKTLAPSDTLVQSLKAESSAAENLIAATPQSLLEQLKQIPSHSAMGNLSNRPWPSVGSIALSEPIDFLSPPQADDELGRFGDYRVLSVLGQGGMGVVFEAEEITLRRKVALKIIAPRLFSIPAAKERFLREAQAAASLKSDHIVTVYRVDEVQGIPFLAMELLRGRSLEEHFQTNASPWTLPALLSAAIDIARGLAEAHRFGLIHRDIKPANLWMEETASGVSRLKILDFGLVLFESDEVRKTQTGAIVGTPAFMAPEQARGDKKLTARADLFSLGAVLYLLSTGRAPFQSDSTYSTLFALATATPTSPCDVNREIPIVLSELIMQLLEKDPVLRPESTHQVIQQLESIQLQISRGLPLATRVATTLPTASALASGSLPPRRRFSRSTWVMAAVLLLLVSSLAFASQVLYWQTSDGKIVRIETNDPSIQISIANGELQVINAFAKPLVVKPGNVDLKIIKESPDGERFEFETDKLVVRRGENTLLRIEVVDDQLLIKADNQLVDSRQLPASKALVESYQNDRKAAEWALSMGGDVDVSIVNRVRSGDRLPAEPFFLRGIVILDNRVFTENGFASLASLKHLTVLRLDGSLVQDAWLVHLKNLKCLRELSLFGTKVSNDGLVHIHPLTDLTVLGLGGGSKISDSGLAFLRDFHALEKLYLDGTRVTDDCLPLFKDLKHLEELNLGQTRVSEKGLLQLLEFQALTSVCLTGLPVSDTFLDQLLNRFPAMHAINLDSTKITEQGVRRLHALPNLKSVFLGGNALSPQVIEDLRSAKPNCSINL